MDKTKTGKYIVTEPKPRMVKRASDTSIATMWLDNEVIEGSFFLHCVWFLKPFEHSTKSHAHDCDEVIAFFGSNAEDWRDLGGEIELWLDGEKHILTKSCLVFVPKGMKHCPLIIRRVDRPILHFTTGPDTNYVRLESNSPSP